MRLLTLAPFYLLVTTGCAGTLPPPQHPTDLPKNVDTIARDVLEKTGVPSASVAVVQSGKIAYVKAYGNARLDPLAPAAPDMRYCIGSISKQFTAAAVMLLVEEGKLGLDDPISKYVPGLTRGDDITIRMLLSHTSGYQDYAPQDYMIPDWEKPISGQAILDRWAKRPLDFEPGTKWQYSNTNFVIAGMIIEKAGGAPLFDLLKRRVFDPLGMRSVTNSDLKKLSETDPTGYLRHALGPLHPAPKEGPGWMFAAGELAMTAEDLAKWDIALMHGAALTPASYRAIETEVLLKSGAGTHYGLGIGVRMVSSHRVLEHGGEVSGYVAENVVLPDDDLAIVVLTNQDASAAADQIATRTREALLEMAVPRNEEKNRAIRRIFDDLALGKIDRSLFTPNANQYFGERALRDYSESLSKLGKPDSFAQKRTSSRGGMTFRRFEVKYPKKTLNLTIYETAEGKFEQFLIDAED
ncbi:MAG TPA: serine hydrolase domain-containing protein [Polyangiaceae bacterium]|nr:serine hydrolase domain-containing protein [Polyangiaceae bacterium]